MKWLLFLLYAFQVNQSMEIVQSPQKEWRDDFSKLDKQKYNDAVQYDLDMRLWEDNRKNVVHNNVSLLAHGWGANPTTMIDYARVEGPHRIPGDKVTFCFQDAFINHCWFMLYSSFGQVEDIKSLLVTMKAVHDCCWIKNNVGCNLFGQSRGAAAVTNALAVLNTKIDEWNIVFADIKTFFTDDDRNQMITMIRKGVVVLDTPMVTMKAGVDAHVHQWLGGMVDEQWFSSIVHDYGLPLITSGNYNPSGSQALTSVKNIPNNLKLLVHFQNNDAAVGNTLDKEFSKALCNHLGEQNVWIVLGDDGGKEFDDETWQMLQVADQEHTIQQKWWLWSGLAYRAISAHNAGFIALLQSGVLNAFFKKHDCSYYWDHAKLNYGANILKKSHCIQDFEKYFKNYGPSIHL